MGLFEQIYKDMIDAKKARDEFRGQALSFIYADLKKFKIDTRRELTDEDVINVLNKALKQRRDSYEQFANGNRPELAEKEKKEIEIILCYLPKQMSEQEVFDFIKKEALELKVSSMKDMSKLMGAVMPKLKGVADGKLASETVKKVLNSLAPQA